MTVGSAMEQFGADHIFILPIFGELPLNKMLRRGGKENHVAHYFPVLLLTEKAIKDHEILLRV